MIRKQKETKRNNNENFKNMFVDLFGVGYYLKRSNAGQRGRHPSVAQRFRHDGQVRAGPQTDAL